MTSPQTSHAKPIAALVALAWTAVTFSATVTPAPAYAGESGPFYRAELAAPAGEARAIASGVAWSCTDTVCAAGKTTSRPVVVCARLVKQVGPVESFVADGEALNEEDLARCNR